MLGANIALTTADPGDISWAEVNDLAISN